MGFNPPRALYTHRANRGWVAPEQSIASDVINFIGAAIILIGAALMIVWLL